MKLIVDECMKKNHITEYGTAVIPENMRPFNDLKYAVSFVVPLPNAIVKNIVTGPTKIYFHHYRTINAYIDRVSIELCLTFREHGHDAAYIPASQSVSDDGYRGDFPHKTAAVMAGLGGIGKNVLFLSSRYGAAVRLGTVFTSAPLPENAPAQNPCKNCGRCVKACPSGALSGKSWQKNAPLSDMIDVSLCSHYMKTAYKDIGRGAVCGICFAVCPAGKNDWNSF